ncbi:MAG TPA: phosphoglucosamine mutase, partial [Rickettsiales bacterium]|nr:phosphoglucosamine mutase [Rickettsiales bacterium]
KQNKMKKYFGTDGIRGQANKFPMTAEIALKVGMAVGAKFMNGGHRHRVVIGKDTRLSGYMIEPALTAGFVGVGMDVFLLGPIPTPAVSMLTRSLRADIGIMISASHNPYHDNGIKIFDANGNKLSDAFEFEIENLIPVDISQYLAKPQNLGRVKRLDEGKERYIEFVKNSFAKDKTLNGLKIVIDCANGAAYAIAPTIFWELGAEIVTIGVNPNGFNINDNCGSTSPERLRAKVLEEEADIGIALDGDADRLLIIDEQGKIIDGDKLIALIAEKLHNEGRLKKDTVIITQMSNLALENYLRYMGINTVRVGVGDRYVLEEIKKNGYNFGGEQSGHIILTDYSTTGDGLVAALQILSIVVSEGKKVSELANIYEANPQILKNVKLSGSANPLAHEDVTNFIKQKQMQVGKKGRIFIRKSGTENLIRVMVEGEDLSEIENIANEIIAMLKD